MIPMVIKYFRYPATVAMPMAQKIYTNTFENHMIFGVRLKK